MEFFSWCCTSLIIVWLATPFLPSCLEIISVAYCVLGCKCFRTGDRLTVECDHYLPNFLPEGTSAVFVKDLHTTHLLPDQFSDHAWKNLTELRLQSWKTEFIHDLSFFNLLNLEYLKISFDILSTLPAGCFSPMQRLRVLDLSGNGHLTFEEVTKALSFPGVLPNLEGIYFDKLQTYRDPATLLEPFFSALASKPIKRLSLSGANFNSFCLQSFVPLGMKLEVLNISDISLASMNFIDLLSRNKFVTLPSNFFSSLQVMDISYAKLPGYLLLTNARNQVWEYDCASPLYQAQHMIANGISPFEVRHVNVTLLSRNCRKQLFNKIEARYNNLVWIDTHFSRDLFSFREVDLSYNRIQYISPNLTAHFSQTVHFDVSHNELHRMETVPEFKEFFNFNTVLEYVDLSFNGFTKLPETFFHNATSLTVLKLSGNQFEKIDFQMETLTRLQYLDISLNNIMYINGVTQMNLQSLFGQRIFSLKNGTEDDLRVNMDWNHLVCSCETLESLYWVMENKLYYEHIDRYTCTFKEKNEPLNLNTLDVVHSYCAQSSMVLTTIATGLALILSIYYIVYRISSLCDAYHTQKAAHNFVNRYRSGEIKGKFLIFLSYASVDSDFVLQLVYQQLKQKLVERLGADDNLICHHEEHFFPGHPIAKEAEKYIIDESITILLVVSDAYCESIFCQHEAKLAEYSNKPVILMLREQVDVSKMSPELSALFSRYTRVKWENVSGKYVMKPDWDTLCDSIFALAEDYIQKSTKIIAPCNQ
ncbi:hypothetical protein CHS0354_020904 [Potamilus streckersoni]|uniref:TIR domain-containing protein n=1 Tax=Potamilus streckersoni TaxID=2493646 RepID=A0AAE0SWF1_9BIVA|nr:hypothetical protein CHS0354_020904 [Potamilus streckersoni]